MAITAQQSNFVTELMNEERVLTEAINRWAQLRARYDANSFNAAMTDTDLLAVPTFAHLTEQEVKRFLGVLDAIVLLYNSNITIGGNTDLAKNHALRMRG